MTTFHFHFAGTATTIAFVEAFLPWRSTDRTLDKRYLGDGVTYLNISSINYSRGKGAVIDALSLCCPDLIYEVCDKNDKRLHEPWGGRHSNYFLFTGDMPFEQAALYLVSGRGSNPKPSLEEIRRRWHEQLDDPVALPLALLPGNPLLSSAIRTTTEAIAEAWDRNELDKMIIPVSESSSYYIDIISMIRFGLGLDPLLAKGTVDKHAFSGTDTLPQAQ